MKYLDLTFDDPAANLACDEALLEKIENDASADDCLRVWQANNHFVVLGHSSRCLSDVNVIACKEDRISILRRVSGGGTVIQGPGCLNYALVFRRSARRLKSIDETFRTVLQRHSLLIDQIYGAGSVRLEGTSDLAIDGRKFSGNSQYRKSSCVLVHGTFLLNFELQRIERYLALPERQPAYRGRRSHLQFLANLGIDGAQLCERLRKVWRANEACRDVPLRRIDELVGERYQRREWLEKF